MFLLLVPLPDRDDKKNSLSAKDSGAFLQSPFLFQEKTIVVVFIGPKNSKHTANFLLYKLIFLGFFKNA